MHAVTATAQMTATEFLALPETSTARRRQLIQGELVVNEPSWAHGRALLVIGAALEVWTDASAGRGRAGPPIDVKLDERNVYAPDVVWYRDDRAPSGEDTAPYPVPDIAVEIRSPSTWRFDVGAKKSAYERHGLPELWLVDTAAAVVLVFRRSEPRAPQFDVSLELGAADTLTSPLLPGFAPAVGAIFAA